MSLSHDERPVWWSIDGENGDTLIHPERSDDRRSPRAGRAPAADVGITNQIREALLVAGYEIEERLDDHSNSHVYRARRSLTGEMLAAKVLVEQPHDLGSAAPRFQQEAKLLTTLRHPNLVHALAHGSVHRIRYAILELAEGKNLRSTVMEHGPLAVEQAARIAYQVASVLEYLHQRAIIHRDVKPSNLVLRTDGSVKLLDLGLARVLVPVDTSITVLYDDRLLGTPDFMAPEQALECHLVDARADLYSLGCTLYYLLAGRPPIVGHNLVQSLLGHQHTQPAPLSTLRPEVPRDLMAVCERLMAKRPCDRYETAGEAATALANWA